MKIESCYTSYIQENAGDDGLIIDFRSRLGIKLKITTWQSGLRVFRHAGTGWSETRTDPGLPLLDMLDEGDTRNQDIARWIESIPDELSSIVQPFVYYQWSVLWLLLHFPAARELFVQPRKRVLIWLIAIAVRDQKMTNQEISELLGLKQPVILRRTYGNGEPAAIKLLGKIVSDRFSAWDFNTITAALSQERVRYWLRNIHQVTIPQLQLLMAYLDLCEFQFFWSYFDQAEAYTPGFIARAKHMRHTLEDTVRLGKSLNIGNVESVLKRSPTFGHAQRMHDRLVNTFNRQQDPDPVETAYQRAFNLIRRNRELYAEAESTLPSDFDYPDPVLEGISYIVPIRTRRDLNKEGRIMHHCVGSYHSVLADGQSNIYKVLFPKRSTLEITHCRANEPLIKQFKGIYNSNPGMFAILLVRHWLNKQCSKSNHDINRFAGTKPVLLIGIGYSGCRVVRDLRKSMPVGVQLILTGDSTTLSAFDHIESVDKLPLTATLLKGSPVRPLTESDNAMNDGFWDLMAILMEEVKHITVVAGFRDRSLQGIGCQLAKMAKGFGVKTTCAVSEPYDMEGQCLITPSRVDLLKVHKAFDAVLVETLRLPSTRFLNKRLGDQTIGQAAATQAGNALLGFQKLLNHFFQIGEQGRQDILNCLAGRTRAVSYTATFSINSFDTIQIKPTLEKMFSDAVTSGRRFRFILHIETNLCVSQKEGDELARFIKRLTGEKGKGVFEMTKTHPKITGVIISLLITRQRFFRRLNREYLKV